MIKTDFKLYLMVLIISVMGFLSAIFGGSLYYSTLKKDAIALAYEDAEESVKVIGEHIESNISWSLKAVKALAGLTELEQFLISRNAAWLSAANAELDDFNRTMQFDVCYLMDRSGNTLASSNRNEVDSFVGKNFDFRPYFRQAIKGVPTAYMALGTVSKNPGIYFSHPVYGPGEKGPLGVAVIKASIEPIKENLKNTYDGILLFIDPLGVVFVSNRADWLFHVLWEMPPEKIAAIAETRQFGKGPFTWTGVKPLEKNHAVDKQGNVYRIHRYEITNPRGWQLIYLHNEHVLSEKVITPITKSVGSTAVILCVIFGAIILFLYLKTKNEIVRRSKAEKQNQEMILELQDALAKIKTLSGFLPICASCKKIRDDKGYWNQIESYISNHSEAEFSHGICPECAKKLYPDLDIYDENET
jgi:C4-dicarboxylate-specific signal transduction histidine kinase